MNSKNTKITMNKIQNDNNIDLQIKIQKETLQRERKQLALTTHLKALEEILFIKTNNKII